MFQNLYGWIQDLAVWIVISAAALQAMPGKNYGKYVRFFTGLVTVLLLISPVLKVTGMNQTMDELLNVRQQEEQVWEEEKYQDILEGLPLTGGAGTGSSEREDGDGFALKEEEQANTEESRIRVEEIEIGK